MQTKKNIRIWVSFRNMRKLRKCNNFLIALEKTLPARPFVAPTLVAKDAFGMLHGQDQLR